MSAKPLAVDLYCGLGGWASGFLASGYDVVGFDIERHDYGSGGYPGHLVLQDVLTLHGRQFRDAAVIVASPPCFVESTLILTARGLLPISEVAVDDLVLTHRNRWRKVLKVGSTISRTVNASGYGGSLEGTPEHPIYARRNEGSIVFWNKSTKQPDYKLKRLGDPEWIPLSETAGHHWASPTFFEALPVPDLPNGLANIPLFWWIVGRWVGDGWVRFRDKTGSGDEVIICCGNKEAEELATRLSSFAPKRGPRAKMGELHWRRSSERTTTRFTAASNSLAEWLVSNFGRYADGKSWPAWVLGMDESHRKALLDGYVSADGSEGRNGPTQIIRTATISKSLAIGTRLIASSLGYCTTVFHCSRSAQCTIEGRRVNQKNTWSTNWIPGSGSNRLVERCDHFLWGLVRKVEAAQESACVWNLEVEEDNSYTADGIVVHNCQEYSYMAMPWSRAKQIRGALLGKGNFPEPYSGSRTIERLNALFDACFRIQREACEAAGRYIPMVVENVKGAQPWVGKAKANYGSFYLWGDVAMVGTRVVAGKLHIGSGIRPRSGRKNNGGSWFAIGSPGQTNVGQNPDGRKVADLDWSKYGKPGYKAKGFNVEPARRHRDGLKVPMNFHEHDKTGLPGRSFQSVAVHGFEWRDCNGIDERRKENIAAHREGTNDDYERYEARHVPAGGIDCTAGKPNDDERAQATALILPRVGDLFGWSRSSALRNNNSKSKGRKAASAEIAKIPPPLSYYIAQVYKPEARA